VITRPPGLLSTSLDDQAILQKSILINCMRVVFEVNGVPKPASKPYRETKSVKSFLLSYRNSFVQLLKRKDWKSLLKRRQKK
jgi:hypothetical protein